MESLIVQAQEVLNNLKKNDDTIGRLLNDVSLIKEKAQNFSWAKEKLSEVDIQCDVLINEGIGNGDTGARRYSTQHYPIHHEAFSTSQDVSDRELNERNSMMLKELNGFRDANVQLTNENEKLAVLLNEHNNVLQHVMEKYRVHVVELLSQNENEMSENARKTVEKLDMEIAQKDQKIVEMAQVMRAAIKLDSEASKNELEWVSQLFTENKLLRELLEVKRTALSDKLWDEVYKIKEKNSAELLNSGGNDSIISCAFQPNSDLSFYDVLQ